MASNFVVFHHDDSDGLIGAYAIQAKLNSDQVSFIPCNYNDQIPLEGVDGAEVYFVDFIPDDYEKVFAEIAKRAKKLTIFDHHSSKADVADVVGGWKFDNVEITIKCEIGTSGGMLAWNELLPEVEVPEFFKIISDFDTFNMEKGKDDFYKRILPFQFGFMSVHGEKPILLPDLSEKISLYIKNQDETIFKPFMDECFSKGNVIFPFLQESWTKQAAISAFEAEFEGKKAICMNICDKGSMQFDSVYDQTKHDLMFGFEWRKDHWSISLYTESDKVNCGEIAKKFGGGGHDKAAGCSMFDDVFSHLKMGNLEESKKTMRRAALGFNAAAIGKFCECCGITNLADQFTESFGDSFKCWQDEEAGRFYVECSDCQINLNEVAVSRNSLIGKIREKIASDEKFKDFPDPDGILIFKR